MAGTAWSDPPSGVIAGVHGGVGVVWSASTGGFTPLPRARNPGSIALSPDARTALYFTPSAPGDDVGPLLGWESAAPFLAASRIADADDALVTDGPARVVWIDPRRAAVSAYEKQWWYDTERQSASAAPAPVESASDNGWMAYSTDTQIRVRRIDTGTERVLFDIRKPAALRDALARLPAKSGVRDLQDEYDDEMARSAENWTISTAVLSHDGRYVTFLSDCGTGQGAQGNSTMGFVRVDVQTGRTRVLERLGVVFGRPPTVLALSPDGRRLLVASSAHNSAADSSFTVRDVDIDTGKTVDLLASDPRAKRLANNVEGACWSPDSRYVAVSVRYYDARSADADSGGPKADLEIKDATTGRTVRVVKDFAQPSWGH